MRILVIDPNTTTSTTATIAAAARSVAAAGTGILDRTATTGPASIEGHCDKALALPGLLDAPAKGKRAGADKSGANATPETMTHRGSPEGFAPRVLPAR